MAKKTLPTIEELRKLLRCEPETGLLFWRERTPDMFEDGMHSSEHSCNAWNARYCGKMALAAIDGKGYFRGRVLGQNVSAHRVIWAIVHGEWPKDR